MSDMSKEAALCARFESSITKANRDAPSGARPRPANASVIAQIGATRFLLRIAGGRLQECTRDIPLFCPADFVVKGSPEAWSDLWEAMPRPGRHDIFALTKAGEIQVDGNMQVFFSCLQYFKDLLSIPRHA